MWRHYANNITYSLETILLCYIPEILAAKIELLSSPFRQGSKTYVYVSSSFSIIENFSDDSMDLLLSLQFPIATTTFWIQPLTAKLQWEDMRDCSSQKTLSKMIGSKFFYVSIIYQRRKDVELVSDFRRK